MAIDYTNIEGVLMDVDGVLWRGTEAIPGASTFIEFLLARSIPFALVTNNSNQSPGEYRDKLARLQIGEVDESSIMTSGRATAAYLTRSYPAGTPVHVLGGDGLRGMVTSAGMTLTDALPCAAVVVGIDFTLTYDKLRTADALIRQGADFIGTNADASFPMAHGPAPGAGSILALLHTSTGRSPVVIGKPNRAMFDAALAVTGTTPEHTLMIGDRLDTDIEGAVALGICGALVLTGVTTAADAAAAPSADAVYLNLQDLLADWSKQADIRSG